MRRLIFATVLAAGLWGGETHAHLPELPLFSPWRFAWGVRVTYQAVGTTQFHDPLPDFRRGPALGIGGAYYIGKHASVIGGVDWTINTTHDEVQHIRSWVGFHFTVWNGLAHRR